MTSDREVAGAVQRPAVEDREVFVFTRPQVEAHERLVEALELEIWRLKAELKRALAR